MTINKLALGTAQFGLNYGINNQRGQIDENEAFAILTMAQDAGVDTIDTASAYGNSEDVLGVFMTRAGHGFKFISKLSRNGFVGAELEKTLMRLKAKAIYGYLLHNFDIYKRNPAIFDELIALRAQNKIKKIGFSLYYPAELELILKNKLPIDIIQLPYSVFDQRFSEYLLGLKKERIEVYARSVFLQGLVFEQPDSLDTFFLDIKYKLIRLRKIAIEINIPLHRLCLQFVLMNNSFDKVVVGVDGKGHFSEIINSFNCIISDQVYCDLLSMAVTNEQIIVPSNWGKVKA